ncbi:MAG: HicB family protein [Anaerolinea sp.]|nr:HicB family protein [Anaerolinea sp.]
MMDAYTIILSPEPDGPGYAVIVPAMPGALTQGDSREEALANAAEVMALWLEVSAEHGEAPLVESRQLIAAEVESVLEDRDEEGWDRTIELAVVSPAVAMPA